LLAAAGGCAQITSTSQVELVGAPGEPRTFGATDGWELDRAYEVRWVQLGNQLVAEIAEHRACQEIVHVPVVRVERITRRADATIVWEFVVAAALAGFATYALARPEVFGGSRIGPDGAIVLDRTPGYRTGGIFLGIAAVLAASGIYDAVRARDETVYADAFELRPGRPIPCAEPVRPLAARAVTLVVGEHEHVRRTDGHGRVRLALPPEHTFANRKGAIVPRTIPAALRMDAGHAIRVDFAVPYDRGDAPAHTGRVPAEPLDPARARGLR
jgi:hypothetical protein